MDRIQTEIVVIGAGPGGYAAAFDAADRGRDVLLVESAPRLGGVCLREGCLPSKALLHASALLAEARAFRDRGIDFGEPRIDLDRLRGWKDEIVRTLSEGIEALAKARSVRVLGGRGTFESSQRLRVETEEGPVAVEFGTAIVATGSRPALPSALAVDDPRVMTAAAALDLPEIPNRLLVVGGGYIGMELGTVYAALGSDVVLVEALPSLLAGADPDLVRYVRRRAEEAFGAIHVRATVRSIEPTAEGLRVAIEREDETTEDQFDRVLIAVGRRPNSDGLGLENTSVECDERGFVRVDPTMRTDDPAIYAIGDLVGGPMLAHKATAEARRAVAAITGDPPCSAEQVIPAVLYTDPELAWCGLTETEAKRQGIRVTTARFPWTASGRALSLGRTDGMTKLVIDPSTERILGVGIVGVGAGELIAEGVLAVQEGLTAKALGDVVHPHPTLSETLMEAAEVFDGRAIHRTAARRRTRR